MHWIIISPMIYNVKRIYICLSDIFKLFQDFFKRNSGNHSSPHRFPHNPTFYDKTPHKEGKRYSLIKNIKSLPKGAPAMVTTIKYITAQKSLFYKL